MSLKKRNIVYKTDELINYFKDNRRKWSQFYPSEKWILEKAAGVKGGMGSVLDIGCAAGGLGAALEQRFSVKEYVGVDINSQAIDYARSNKMKYPHRSRFICGDILKVNAVGGKKFDNVFSLSCADWNVATEDIVRECWRHVSPGGNFILTLRLTSSRSLLDMSGSFQYIHYGDGPLGKVSRYEKAPYIVLNFGDAMAMLSGLSPRPARITAYGYWGPPSKTARTKYKRLVFAALAVSKSAGTEKYTAGEFHLPADLYFKSGK